MNRGKEGQAKATRDIPNGLYQVDGRIGIGRRGKNRKVFEDYKRQDDVESYVLKIHGI